MKRPIIYIEQVEFNDFHIARHRPVKVPMNSWPNTQRVGQMGLYLPYEKERLVQSLPFTADIVISRDGSEILFTSRRGKICTYDRRLLRALW